MVCVLLCFSFFSWPCNCATDQFLAATVNESDNRHHITCHLWIVNAGCVGLNLTRMPGTGWGCTSGRHAKQVRGTAIEHGKMCGSILEPNPFCWVIVLIFFLELNISDCRKFVNCKTSNHQVFTMSTQISWTTMSASLAARKTEQRMKNVLQAKRTLHLVVWVTSCHITCIFHPLFGWYKQLTTILLNKFKNNIFENTWPKPNHQSSCLFETFVLLWGHFVSIYSSKSPPFTRESARWSADPSNIQRYLQAERWAWRRTKQMGWLLTLCCWMLLAKMLYF